MTQTIVNGMATVPITPVLASYLDGTNCTLLAVKLVHDDLLTTCTFFWQLLYPVTDSTGTTTYQGSSYGNLTATGAYYDAWGGDNNYPFTYVAGQLKLNISQ